VLVAVLSYFFYGSTYQRLSGQDAPKNEGPILAQFAGNGLDSQYPDSLSLNRVTRGSIKFAELSSSFVTVTTQINWPEPEPVRDISFRTVPSTEYLCWGNEFVTGDGTRAAFNDTIFLLDSSRKLFAEGQKPLLGEEAQRELNKGPDVIVALTEPYNNSSAENTIFQIAIIGCQ